MADEAQAPYEFSLGRKLRETPMVAIALDLLRWAGGALELERVSALLLSGYFAGSATEAAARAEFDAFELREGERLRPVIELGEMERKLAESKRRARLSGLRGGGAEDRAGGGRVR